MSHVPSGNGEPLPYVSTGHLPPAAEVVRLVTDAHREVRSVDDGEVSQVYPALARAPREQFGIALAGVNGNVITVGDADTEFTIMSVAKPFVYALVCDAVGPHEARRMVGANATGLPFNATEAVVPSERAEESASREMPSYV